MYIKSTVVPFGYAMIMDDSIITKTPNPILTKRDFCLTNKPNITCSIPTINRIILAINTIETVASAGLNQNKN